MSDDNQVVLLTAREYEAIRADLEWARNTRGIGLLNSPFSLTTTPGKRGRRSRGQIKFRWCTVVTVHADHLDCRPLNTTYPESSQADFTVAKPPDLRKTRFDGLTLPNQDGVMISYTYDAGVTERRTAEDDQGEEEQVVVPAYVPGQLVTVDSAPPAYHRGSLICAISGLSQGTGVTFAGANGNAIAVQWLDMNLSGRCWAENDE